MPKPLLPLSGFSEDKPSEPVALSFKHHPLQLCNRRGCITVPTSDLKDEQFLFLKSQKLKNK